MVDESRRIDDPTTLSDERVMVWLLRGTAALTLVLGLFMAFGLAFELAPGNGAATRAIAEEQADRWVAAMRLQLRGRACRAGWCSVNTDAGVFHLECSSDGCRVAR